MTSLTLVRRFKASPASVYEAFTRPEQIAQWWGPDAGPVLVAETDVRVGGRFRVRFRMLNGDEHESRGEYFEVVPGQRLRFSWCWIGEAEHVSEVTVEIRAMPGGSELTFTHARLPDDAERDSHRQGWEGSFIKLTRLLEP